MAKIVTRLFFCRSSLHSLFRCFAIAWGRHPSRNVLSNYFTRHRQATMTGRQDKEFYWIRLIRLEISQQKITRPWKGKLFGLGGSPSFRVLLAPRFSRGHFFAVFFRITHDGLSERGTTRSLPPSPRFVSFRFKGLLCRCLGFRNMPLIIKSIGQVIRHETVAQPHSDRSASLINFWFYDSSTNSRPLIG